MWHSRGFEAFMSKYGIMTISDLKVSCIIGLNEDERVKTQEIFMDIDVEYDVEEAIKSDAVTLDYVKVSFLCADVAIKGQYFTLEYLCNAALDAMSNAWNITWARITIKKPAAIPKAKYAAISLEKGTRQCGR